MESHQAENYASIGTISDLCRAYNTTFPNVFLPCNFCGNTLSPLECLFFDHAECRLLWKNGVAHAVCVYCLRLLSRFEYLVYYRGSFAASQAPKKLKRPLTSLSIRCLICLRRLKPGDIEKIVGADKQIFVIGNKLRTKCELCELGL